MQNVIFRHNIFWLGTYLEINPIFLQMISNHGITDFTHFGNFIISILKENFKVKKNLNNWFYHIKIKKNLHVSIFFGSGKSSTPRKVLPREKVYPGKSLRRKKSTILIQSSWYWRNLKHLQDEYFHQVSLRLDKNCGFFPE